MSLRVLGRSRRKEDIMDSDRIPPGQHVVERFPVLHYGSVPIFDPQSWDLRVFGLVGEPFALSYDQFLELPTQRLVADIHCVTSWSKLDTVWEGVLFRDFIRPAKVQPDAKFVMVHCEQGYTTNLPLEVIMDDDVLLAYRYNDAQLAPEHGYPLRLVVPKRYFWKSAKWMRGIELMAEDRLGFWEVRGYHNNADPWKEERYA
jgi:DMSO/TMAO reductase YedYZ molybdopterin-dependent catalytic subunit